MNRRSFTFGLGALAAAPLAPVPSFAKTMPTISAAALEYFDWAKMIVRVHHKCSPAMLQRLLKLEPHLALEVQSALLDRGVITVPGLDGVSKAIDPLHQEVFLHQGSEYSQSVNRGSADQANKNQEISEPQDTQPEQAEFKQTTSDNGREFFDEETSSSNVNCDAEHSEIEQENLSLEEGAEPEDDQNCADDPIPAGHTDAQEIPSDFVTADDGGSEDLIEEI